MNRFKPALLLATAASFALASANAYADAPGPNDGDAALHGTGATSIQNVLVQELNCINGNNPLGLPTPTPNGATTSPAEPTSLTTPAGTFNCATQSLFTDFSGKYVATGSGFGRQAWRNATDQFYFAPVADHPTVTTNANPFGPTNPQWDSAGNWNTVQFAFADSSIAQSDITAYNNPNTSTTPATPAVATIGGVGIMIPKFVLPVAIAYNPVYAKRTSDNVELKYNVDTPASAFGGIKLDSTLYCGIFNGAITNWNDPAFSDNNGGHSLQDANDDTTRWTTDGVPIRLVGRMDKSGTTDIFTRALQAQCGAGDNAGGTNHYLVHAETLPYNSGSGVNFSAERSDTGLQSGGAAAGTTNLVGKEYYNTTTHAIAVSANSLSSAPTSQPSGNQGTGLYLVANGSGAVRDAINLTPDITLGTVQVNGKVGYIGADFIANSPTGSNTLFAAALQSGTTEFLLPTASNAITAVGTILPPQSNGSGNYNGATVTDTRQVRDNTNESATTVNATRANPFGWYDVLYSGTTTLASPTVGYPITGTTQFLGYSCYKASNLPHIQAFLKWDYDPGTGSVTDSSGSNRRGIFSNPSSGLLANSNIGALPAAWRTAVRETFLSNTSGLGLDIAAGGTAGKCSAVSGI